MLHKMGQFCHRARDPASGRQPTPNVIARLDRAIQYAAASRLKH